MLFMMGLMHFLHERNFDEYLGGGNHLVVSLVWIGQWRFDTNGTFWYRYFSFPQSCQEYLHTLKFVGQ